MAVIKKLSQKKLRLVDTLVAASKDATGGISSENVTAVLAEVAQAPLVKAEKKLILQAYARKLKREVRFSEAVLEHVGLNESGEVVKHLSTQLKEQHGAHISLRLKENKALLAGVRLTLGDTVWERSAKAKLKALRAAV